jgi:hypothetical protein
MGGSGKRGGTVSNDGPTRASGVDGTSAPRAPEAAQEVERAEHVDSIDEVRAARAEAVERTSGVAGATGAAGVDHIAEVAAALRAGSITVAEAVDRLIDDAVTRRVGRAVEPGGELEARLKRVLRGYAEADPLISAKIRRLEARRPGR